MAKVKSITTTIEDEVVFMVDPTVEYVSLVKHGANRAPFKVLKGEKTKEETNMNKVVQSVLVRNDLSDEDVAKALEGIDKRDGKKYSSFTAYPQVSIEKVNAETVVVVKHEEVDGIYFVLGDLAEGASEGGTLVVDAKEAVDYATMDNLYTELYAMADVVGGAMRQENADVKFRKNTILTAIDNFKSFAEVVLESLSAKKLEKAVNPADHPKLVVDILNAVAPAAELTDDEKAKAAAKAVEEAAKAAAEGLTDEEKAAAKAKAEADEVKPDAAFDAMVDKFNTSLNLFGDKLVESIGAVGKEVKQSNEAIQTSIAKITEGVEEVKNTTLSMKSESDEEDNTDTDEKEVFKGVLFSLK